MKTYRIEFADGVFTTCLYVILLTMACFTLVGIPFAIAFLPCLYHIVEEGEPAASTR